MKKFSNVLLLGSALLMGFIGSGIATMVSADGPASIQACVHQSNGNVRVIAAGEQCHDTETAINWNIQGIEGPMGPAGPIGPQGAQGAVGSSGIANIHLRNGYQNFTASDDYVSASANCLPGEKILSGGYNPQTAVLESTSLFSFPANGPQNGQQAWQAAMRLSLPHAAGQLWVIAICAAP